MHSGLSLADEAALFDKLNRQRKQTGTWDHWKARRAAGDPQVLAIEDVVRRNNLTVHLSPSDGHVACVASLEKVVKVGGTDLLNETLSLIVEVWGGRRDALDAGIIHGLALVLHYLAEPLDLVRLGDVLLEIVPRQLRSQAAALKEITNGTTPVLTALALTSLYNKRPGRKIEVSHKTFGGTGIVNSGPQSRRDPAAPGKRRGDNQSPSLEQIVGERSMPRTVPDAIPHYADTLEHTDAVAKMEGQPVAAIAAALGIPERTVRRIQADLGIREAV